MTCRKYKIICDPIPDCLSTLNVQTSFIGTNVILYLKDKFGNIFELPKTTSNAGIAIIDLAIDLPLRLLNSYAGQFKIWVDVNNETFDGAIFEVSKIFGSGTSYTVDITTDNTPVVAASSPLGDDGSGYLADDLNQAIIS